VETIRDVSRTVAPELIEHALSSADVDNLAARHQEIGGMLIQLTLVDIDAIIAGN